MCGRYALHASPEVVRLQFGLESLPPLAPRYNICPGTQVLAVKGFPGRADLVDWGRIANARGETLADKPMFAAAFRGWRCLVPASGFYEWKALAGRRQPYYVRPKDAPLFALAAIVLLWKGERGVCLVTTGANELVRGIHERMPVIIAPEDYQAWLDRGNKDPEVLRPLVKPYASQRMEAYPVSLRVNRPENDDPTLVESVSLPA